MRFDWRAFCNRNHITYVTSGPNTAKGNISICCPFCGNADPSEHMGLLLDQAHPAWGCLRNAQHRGRHPAKLIAKLLRIPYGTAAALVQVLDSPIDTYEEAIKTLRDGPGTLEARPRKTRPPLPEAFKNLAQGRYASRFLAYLEGRGFGVDSLDVAETYDLRYALTGEQAWRLIFPIYDLAGELVGWTGRAIGSMAGSRNVRYLTSEDFAKDVVLGGFGVPDDAILLVCEGPLDWIKMDYYGSPLGISTVATMGTAYTNEQVSQLLTLQKRVAKTFILFDRDALSSQLRLADELEAHSKKQVRTLQLPRPFDDPGQMTPTAVRQFCSSLI